ncbi:NAD(P)H-binding protein [Nocardia otitidiscaviarum]|uniref:SDR family oxidoreductase n=1 Tax=Nocardia otitidiscaviarum TaxID=1823 RepID=UPI001892D7EB|nr:NAD(P)H-binding protein [Nocardia otitidiscaviarum]MBF6236478.1 NAD(P)H-binding protein [Nocardia otitidiscaviarum]
MILVTGATGSIGGALLSELRDAGTEPVRGLARDLTRASFPVGVEAVEGDLAEPVSLKPAFEGVRAMFYLSRFGPDREILAAARQAGVRQVVLVSSITVLTHPWLGPAAENAAVERMVEDSGMDWTVLRPTQFASNTLMWADAIRAGQPVEVPFADIGLPTIHPADIAAVARVALTDPAHRGRAYALTGPARIPPREQVAAIAAELGREIEVVDIGREQARARMVEVFGAEAADAVLDVTGGDVNDELLRVRDTVQRLTGTTGRTYRRWVAENAEAFR